MQTKHDMRAILGEDFFKEEVRCDYLVPAEMKRLWAVLMDMYLSFAEVCDKYGFRYYVIGGTLLGAIRHKGFIPWDDDFDVAMPREDYDKFMKVCKDDFHPPLFLQTPYTDPDYFVSWIKLRNSKTTGLSKTTSHRRFNQGLYFDIFPMDYCNPNTIEEDSNNVFVSAKKCGAYMRRGSKLLNEKQKQDEITYYTDSPLAEWEKIQHIASNPVYHDSGFICNTVYVGDPYQLRMHPADCYSKIIECPFENITVKIPYGYDTILKIMYKDYMKYPPVEARGARHSDIIFDPDKPYTFYKE